jgi:hypothetical protein
MAKNDLIIFDSLIEKRVGFVWDGLYRHIYVDGAEVAKDTDALSILQDSNGGLHFDVDKDLAERSFWSGLIDDVRIYNQELTP